MERLGAGAGELFDSFQNQPRSAMSLPFRKVDVDAQAGVLRLEACGTEDGSHERPGSGSDIEANTELEVKGAINADRERCLLDLSSNLRAYRDALAQLQTAMD